MTDSFHLLGLPCKLRLPFDLWLADFALYWAKNTETVTARIEIIAIVAATIAAIQISSI